MTAIIAQDGPPEVEYPEDHGPFCRKDCDHPCHDPYDAWVARKNGRTPCLVDDDGGVCGRDDCPRCSGSDSDA